jgi:membrane protein required for colicin V production
MNWLDLAILGSMATGALMGMWVGAIRAAFTAAAVVIGILMAGHFRGNVEALLADYVAGDTVITVLGYAVIILAAAGGAAIAASITRKLASMLLLGWADRAGGMALGLAAATLVSAAAIVGLVGLSDSYELPRAGLTGTVLQRTPLMSEAREGLRKSLDESVMVSVLAKVTDNLPVGALGRVTPARAAAGHNLEHLVQ